MLISAEKESAPRSHHRLSARCPPPHPVSIYRREPAIPTCVFTRRALLSPEAPPRSTGRVTWGLRRHFPCTVPVTDSWSHMQPAAPEPE